MARAPAKKKSAPKKSAPSTKPSRTKAAVRTLLDVAKAKKAGALARRVKRAEALLALIARRKERIVEDFYDIGEALKEILDDRLYEALGHASFSEMLEARSVMSTTAAKRLVAVAEHLPREQALRLGQQKSYDLVAYAAATPEHDVAATLAEVDAEIGGKRLSRASSRELQAAAARARAEGRAAAQTPAQKQAARALKSALAEVKRRVAAWGVGRISVALADDEIVIRLTGKQARKL